MRPFLLLNWFVAFGQSLATHPQARTVGLVDRFGDSCGTRVILEMPV